MVLGMGVEARATHPVSTHAHGEMWQLHWQLSRHQPGTALSGNTSCLVPSEKVLSCSP